jgi:hypothetical protein
MEKCNKDYKRQFSKTPTVTANRVRQIKRRDNLDLEMKSQILLKLLTTSCLLNKLTKEVKPTDASIQVASLTQSSNSPQKIVKIKLTTAILYPS